MRPKFLVLSLLSAAALVGCNQLQKLDEMHDSTQQLSSNTSDLKRVTEDTEGMLTEIHDAGRQGAGVDLRNTLFKNIVNEKKPDQKAVNAGLYLLSFEYQLFTGRGMDKHSGQHKLLEKDAVDEFFNRLRTIARWDKVDAFAQPTALSVGSVDNNKASFNAIAVVLERLNRKQINTPDDPAVSMLDLIEEGLRAGQKIRAGEARLEDYPEYVTIILDQKELALRLLEARYQMLGLAVLDEFTPIGNNLWEGAQFTLLGKKWELNLDEIESAKLRTQRARLESAAKARDMLLELGVKVQLDSKIRDIFSHGKVVQSNDAGQQQGKDGKDGGGIGGGKSQEQMAEENLFMQSVANYLR